MASLKIEAEGGAEEYALETGAVVVGRSLASDVRIKDIKASRRHCQIVKTGDGFHLQDLGSGNGTWLNGVQIKEQRLNPGDRIQIGGTVITFVESPEAPKAPAVPPAKKPAPEPVPPTERAEVEPPPPPAPPPRKPPPAADDDRQTEQVLAVPPAARGTTRSRKKGGSRIAPKVPAGTPSKPPAAKKSNTMTLVAIVGGVVLLAAILFFVMRGDKGEAKKEKPKSGGVPALRI